MIVPCYNEGMRFNAKYFDNLIQIENTRWIFVNDGSTDQTQIILKSYCTKSNTLYLSTPINQGKSNAVAHGMKYILSLDENAFWIGFLDSDGAFATEDVRRLIELINKPFINSFDSIYSSRVKLSGRNIQRRNSRHFFGRLISTFFGIFWPEMPYDTQSGLKLYKADVLKHKIFTDSFTTRWFFDIELHLRILLNNNNEFKVWEEPLSMWNDVPDSKINYLEKLKLLREILKILVLLLNKNEK